MLKRIFALLLCLLMILPLAVGCASQKDDEEEEEELGSYIRMYLSQMIYDFDPAYAYINEATLKVVGLLFEPLFRLNENGVVEKALVKSYEIIENKTAKEYTMMITLRDDMKWNDGTPVTADDVIYAWKRILGVECSSEAAALLFDIKNARKVKEGDTPIDDLGLYAVDSKLLEIKFETKIDYDAFIRNLTSVALCPLQENVVSRDPDWAKKTATISCSGPFRLARIAYGPDSTGYINAETDTTPATLVLERNNNYRRNTQKDKVDKSVLPYKIIVDFTKTAEEQATLFESDSPMFYVGDIALANRYYYSEVATLTDALSTHVYYFNTSIAPFDNVDVRNALSAAIDRTAIVNAIIYAKAATALVPYGVFENTSGSAKIGGCSGANTENSFRTTGGDILSATADLTKAQEYLTASGINPADFPFAITVHEGDEVHVKIAEMVCEAWRGLGFDVSLRLLGEIVNDDIGTTGEIAMDIRDDLYNEAFDACDFQVIALDLVAISPDAFSILAPFAKAFSGQAMDMNETDISGSPIYKLTPHKTKFDFEEYNDLIERAYNQKNLTKRAVLLHEAEQLLLSQMPVIPIIFNVDGYIYDDANLKNLNSTYYAYRDFRKLKLKDYELYVEED